MSEKKSFMSSIGMSALVMELARRAGITIGPIGSSCDIEYTDPDQFAAAAGGGSLSFGNGYMFGEWFTRDTDTLFRIVCQVIRSDIPSYFRNHWKAKLTVAFNHLFNRQNPVLSRIVAEKHYDIPISFYRLLLGPSEVYTAALLPAASDPVSYRSHSLEEAQRMKLWRICNQLGILELRAGRRFRFLDIGCGFGSLLSFVAHECKARGVLFEGVGITNSSEHAAYVRERAKREGINVTVFEGDYRHFSTEHPFDAIASIEMIEHVGQRYLRRYMQLVHDWLKEGGKFLLQGIVGPDSMNMFDPWLDRWIFPNAMLLSHKLLGGAYEGLFRLEDSQSLRSGYVFTLLKWLENLNANRALIEKDFDTEFFRMFQYYLATCAATFAAGENDVIQFTLVRGRLLPPLAAL